MQSSLSIKCPAKINLSLDVTSRREDGYHNLEMIMQEIKLYDILTFSVTKQNDDTHIVLLTDNTKLPDDDSNLITKAAKLFSKETGINFFAEVNIEKNIPMGAGLGGGSSDAAGTLMALNEIFGTNLSKERLATMGKELGADVPFFIYGGCMFAEGIGEKLTPMPSLENVFILVATPNVHVSTAYVYKSLVLDGETPHPDTKNVIKALETNNVDLLAQSAGNVLETVTTKEFPEINQFKNIMKDHRCAYTLMSGSGSSVFGVFTDKVKVQSAFETLKAHTDNVFLV